MVLSAVMVAWRLTVVVVVADAAAAGDDVEGSGREAGCCSMSSTESYWAQRWGSF